MCSYVMGGRREAREEGGASNEHRMMGTITPAPDARDPIEGRELSMVW